jgi:hypothetical protein
LTFLTRKSCSRGDRDQEHGDDCQSGLHGFLPTARSVTRRINRRVMPRHDLSHPDGSGSPLPPEWRLTAEGRRRRRAQRLPCPQLRCREKARFHGQLHLRKNLRSLAAPASSDHRRVAAVEIDRSIGKILTPGTAALGLVVDGDPLVSPAKATANANIMRQSCIGDLRWLLVPAV